MKPLLISFGKIVFALLAVALLSDPAMGASGATQGGDSSLLFSYSVLGVDEGLASADVLCALQDSKGFMWFATRNGLNRYDGSMFTLYSRQYYHMRENKIAYMAEDDCGRLWLLYSQRGNGLTSGWMMDVMDMNSNQVEPFKAVFKNAPFTEDQIHWIGSGDSNKLIVVTMPNIVWQFTCAGGFKKLANSPWHLSPSAQNHCLFHKNYGLVCSNENALYVNDSFRVLPVLKAKLPFAFDSTGNPLQLVEQGQDIYKIADEKANVLYDKITVKQGSDKRLFYHGRSNTALWWYNDDVFLFRNGTAINLQIKERAPDLKNYLIQSFIIDAQGNIWICTNKGVIKVKIESNRFHYYFKRVPGGTNSYFITWQVRGLFADSADNLYANVWQQFCVAGSPGKYKVIAQTTDEDIMYALMRYNNRFWLGTKGLATPNDKTGKVKVKRLGADVWALFGLDSDRILVSGDHKYPLAYSISGDSFSVCRLKIKAVVPSISYRFRWMRDGTIGMACETGMYILNKDGEPINYYGNRGADKNQPLISDDLFDFYEVSDSIVWLATNGEGLVRWNRLNNSFKQFTVADGLPSNIIYRIETDRRGNMWLSTDNGLFRFDTRTFTVNTYTIEDGILQKEFNRISSCTSPSGKMFFGGLEGVTAFNPEDFYRDSTMAAPLRITSYTVFSGNQEKVLDETTNLLRNNAIVLEPGSRFFNLSYMLLDYEKGRHNYSYIIEGLDKNWTHTTDNFMRISGLPYGSYTLRIKGQSTSGIWSSNEITIPLIVITPLLQRTWFQILLGLLLLGLLLAFISYRTYRLRRDKEDLERTVELRTSQLRELLGEKDLLMKEIHHRVKNNLQVISALLEMQGNRTGDEGIKSAITESQNRVLSISFIHQNLYQNEDLKGVEFRSFSLELTKHIEKVFARPGLTVSINNQISETLLDIDTAVPLGLIINELMTNSFKYAFNNRVTGNIEMQLNNIGKGEYRFRYFDDGPGIDDGVDIRKSRSLGLRLVNQLTRQLAGTLVYSNRNGSTFEFNFKDFEARSNMT